MICQSYIIVELVWNNTAI